MQNSNRNDNGCWRRRRIGGMGMGGTGEEKGEKGREPNVDADGGSASAALVPLDSGSALRATQGVLEPLGEFSGGVSACGFGGLACTPPGTSSRKRNLPCAAQAVQPAAFSSILLRYGVLERMYKVHTTVRPCPQLPSTCTHLHMHWPAGPASAGRSADGPADTALVCPGTSTSGVLLSRRPLVVVSFWCRVAVSAALAPVA